MEKELIDSNNIFEHQIDYTFSHGFNFGISARIATGIISIAFIFMLFVSIFTLNIVGILAGLFFLIPISFVVTSSSGVQLCKQTKYQKTYGSYLGIKKGKWKSTRAYTDVAILTMRKNKTISNGFGARGTRLEEVETGVYFLIPSHRKRILIKVCKNKADADEWAEKIANEFDKKLCVFNPKISEATRARRR